MYDFFSALPPDILLRLVHDRQADVRDGIARARLAAQVTAARTDARRDVQRASAFRRNGRPSPALWRLWSAFGRLDR